MGEMFTITLVVLFVEILILYFIGNSAQGTDDFGAGCLFFLLLGLFGLMDLCLLTWQVVAHWRS